MYNIFIFITSFYLLLLSIIGYGLIFQNLFFMKLKNLNHENTIFLGFFGLTLVTFISLFTSLFVQHGYIHNLILHLIGIILFFFTPIKNKNKFLKIIFLISILSFICLLISKTHDDFSYYHLPFTKYLTEQKIIFGMGHLNHGYNLLSSLFFLNSTFYLPFIEYYSFHFSLIFFLIFFNFFLFKEIQNKKNENIIKYLYLFAFVFFNLSFNRIAEYGTDKVGQLLIVIIIIKLFDNICIKKDDYKKIISKILPLIPLLALCITLKTYFLPYILLGLLVLLINQNYFKSLKRIFFTKAFLFFLLMLIFNFLHHFISTGCIISPLAYTCFGDLMTWSKDIDVIKGLSLWLEQWSKAGAGPNFRVENVDKYLLFFNWVPNWFDKYFLPKFLDQLLILISTFIIVFLLFKKLKLKKSNKSFYNKKFLYFYLIISIIFFIWFFNHPTLRYGGYSIVFLTISLPIVVLFQNFENSKFFYKKFSFLIILVIILFNIKNFNRIVKEFERGDIYQYSNFPFYSIAEKKYSSKKFNSGLTIYAAHHCWATPSPCGHLSDELKVLKKNGYFFISKFK